MFVTQFKGTPKDTKECSDVSEVRKTTVLLFSQLYLHGAPRCCPDGFTKLCNLQRPVLCVVHWKSKGESCWHLPQEFLNELSCLNRLWEIIHKVELGEGWVCLKFLFNLIFFIIHAYPFTYKMTLCIFECVSSFSKLHAIQLRTITKLYVNMWARYGQEKQNCKKHIPRVTLSVY